MKNQDEVEGGEYQWEDIYPELVNKLRWGVQTTFSQEGASFSYSDAQRIATVLSGDAIDLLKASKSSPEVLASTSAIRTFYTQRKIDTLT